MLPSIIDLSALPDSRGVFVVGGAVRDLLSGRKPADVDLAVAQDPLAFAKALARNTDGRLVVLGRDDLKIYRVVTQDRTWDVSPLYRGDIAADLHNRDFTVNAVALPAEGGQPIDPLCGIEDLGKGVIRMVSASAFTSDPLRLLRAFRFAATLEFSIESGTLEAVRRCAPLIARPAGERVREEWFKLLAGEKAAAHVRDMHEAGLLCVLFPEMAPLAGIGKSRFHDFDALEHSLRTLENLETLLADLPIPGASGLPEAPGANSDNNQATLKCAALWHDLGKARTRTIDASGRQRFHGHAKAGEKSAEQIARRLKFSNADRERLCILVALHMRPEFLLHACRGRGPTRRAVTRFFMAAGASAPLILTLAMADLSAKKEKMDEPAETGLKFFKDLFRQYACFAEKSATLPRLVTGRDLIRIFGLSPSPAFSKILKHAHTAQLSGDIADRRQALDLVQGLIDRGIR